MYNNIKKDKTVTWLYRVSENKNYKETSDSKVKKTKAGFEL